MKVAYKWKANNHKYLYITDKGTKNQPFIFDSISGTCTYSGGVVMTGMTRSDINEPAIATIVTNMDITTYRLYFDSMVALAGTDNDFKVYKFMDASFYFNIEADECIEEAIIPVCEAEHDDVVVEANKTLQMVVVNGASIKLTENNKIEVTVPDGPIFIDSNNLIVTDTSITATFSTTADKIQFMKNGASGSKLLVDTDILNVTGTTTNLKANNFNVDGSKTEIACDTVILRDKNNNIYVKVNDQLITANANYGEYFGTAKFGYDKTLSPQAYTASLKVKTKAEDESKSEYGVISIDPTANSISINEEVGNGYSALKTALKNDMQVAGTSISDLNVITNANKGQDKTIINVHHGVANTIETTSISVDVDTISSVTKGDVSMTSNGKVDISSQSVINLNAPTVNVSGVDLTRLSNAINAVSSTSTVNLTITTGGGNNKLSADVKNKSITTQKIADGAIGTTQIAVNGVEENNVKNGAVTEDKLATDAVTTVKIKDAAVTTDKIADSAVTSVKLASDSVSTVKIENGAVTSGKIATDAVTTVKIKDGAVTADKIADQAVTYNKIKNDAKNALSPINAIILWSGSKSDVPDNYFVLPDVNSSTTISIKNDGVGTDYRVDTTSTSYTFNGKTYSTNDINFWLNTYRNQIQNFNLHNYNGGVLWSTNFVIWMPETDIPMNRWRTSGSALAVNYGFYIMRFK